MQTLEFIVWNTNVFMCMQINGGMYYDVDCHHTITVLWVDFDFISYKSVYFLWFRLQSTRVQLLPGMAQSEPEHPARDDLQERAATCCHLVSTAHLILDCHQVLQLP